MTQQHRGAAAVTLSFFLWAALPIFWKALGSVPVLEISSHRIVWVLITLIPILFFRGSIGAVVEAFKQPEILALHAIAGLCIVANWLIYIWATINGHIIEGALGYYLNPFCYILIGRIFWGERTTPLQNIAILIAALGVGLQFTALQGFPWIALGIAITFTAYGVIRKKSPLGSLSGLAVESALLLPLGLGYLIFLQIQGQALFLSNTTEPSLNLLLVSTGLITAIPLLLFGYGARIVSLTLLGILQFIGPTGQFLLGWLHYHEPLPLLRLISFILIWIAVVTYIYSLKKKKV